MSYWFIVSPPGSVSMSLVLECSDIVAVPQSTRTMRRAGLILWFYGREERYGNGVDSHLYDLQREEDSSYKMTTKALCLARAAPLQQVT